MKGKERRGDEKIAGGMRGREEEEEEKEVTTASISKGMAEN